MTTIPSPMWNEAFTAVDAAQRILLVTHVEPDGDAIGSMLGLGNALRQQGKYVDMAVDYGVPSYLAFLPGADNVLPKLDSGEWDVMISLDASDEERSGHVGVYGRAHSRTVINVDHHASNTLFGDIYLIMANAVSTTEIIQDWLTKIGHPLDRSIADPLLAGLVTDTLGFRISKVSAHTLKLAVALMDAGAPLYDIIENTLSNRDFRDVQLWQRILPSVTLQDRVVTGVVRLEDWQGVGLEDETDSGLVSYLITTNEAKVAAVYKQTNDGKVEISFRSKPGFDVSAVAVALGGGGHTQAAGVTIPGTLEQVIAKVTPMLKAAANP